ncbi:hypothetical protein [Prevotella sp. OH937_COT-195]|uniref:hypothetical protein n=1 Tax=Prevotella sp. OH937_COT-195 TaxID=2491051 RepID=UPI000F6497D2|nr:hypothetical protein [Prevotella sp. OH937_COT-195]RRD02990.1 hypothetical protein EII32_00585 [Prevotella sp. OH937_COT-195]
MKRLFFAIITALFIVAVGFAKTRYKIVYSAEKNEQNRVYINPLHEVNMIIERDGDKSMTIDGKKFVLFNKIVKENRYYSSVQYDAADLSGRIYVVSFKHWKDVDPALEYQVVIFSTTDIYNWTYYLSERPVETE